MEEILNELKKPYWWITVVIAGIIINLLASIIFKNYEKYQATKSEKKRKELEKKVESKNKMIELLANNPYGQGYYQFQSLYEQIAANRVLLIGLVFFVVPSGILEIFGSLGYFVSVVFYSIGAIFIIQGFRIQIKASEKREIVDAAVKRQGEINKTKKKLKNND